MGVSARLGWDLSKVIPLVSIFSSLLFSCGSAKKTEKNVEQPVDVAGGLGLTCSVIGPLTDSADVRFGCLLTDNSGEKFQERAGLKLDFAVKSNDTDISLITDAPNSNNNFTFTVPKTLVESVQIEVKFSASKESDEILARKSSSLKQAMLNGCDLKKFKPSFISATAGDGQVELRWQPNGEATPITGYFGRYWEGADYSNDPRKPPLGREGNGNPLGYFPSNQAIISGTSHTVSGLENGKTYTFGVLANEPYRCGYGVEVYISATPRTP